MLSSREIQELSKELMKIYESIEDDLLANVAKRLSLDRDILPDSIDEWRIMKLMELGALRKENMKTLSKKARLTLRQIERIITDLGYKSIAFDEGIYKAVYKAGKLSQVPVAMKMSPGLRQILEGAIDNAKNYFNLINTTALESAQDGFLDIVNQAYLETSLGITDYSTAIRKAVGKLADKGISGATYKMKNGFIVRNHIDVAVRRSIVTSTGQTAGKMQIRRAKEWGSNLVEVTSHSGARPEHAKWQGKIYSLEGESKEYPNLEKATGYGSAAGLKGINCGHDFYPYFEGISEQSYFPYDFEENENVYKESQQQRKFERDIRASKRKVLMLEEMGDTEGKKNAQLKLKEREAKLNEFIEDTGRTKRTNRQQVHGFEHSEAMKAVWTKRKNK